MHGLPLILATMCRNQNQAAVRCPFQFRMGVIFANRRLKGINGSIAGDIDGVFIFAFADQIGLGQLSGREIVLGNDGNCLPVELFRIGRVNIVGAESGFHILVFFD